MRTICRLGPLGQWTGESREIGERDGRPPGWVETAPPTLDAGEFAIWSGSGWSIVTELPEPPAPTLNLAPLPRWRFKAMLRLTGHEADINAWLASLKDPESEHYDLAAWAVASSILEDSDEYRFDHPLTETLRQIAGVTVEQLQQLWDQAHSI